MRIQQAIALGLQTVDPCAHRGLSCQELRVRRIDRCQLRADRNRIIGCHRVTCLLDRREDRHDRGVARHVDVDGDPAVDQSLELVAVSAIGRRIGRKVEGFGLCQAAGEQVSPGVGIVPGRCDLFLECREFLPDRLPIIGRERIVGGLHNQFAGPLQ
jgi:hypothetical protein